jgi:hypothetical protein
VALFDSPPIIGSMTKVLNYDLNGRHSWYAPKMNPDYITGKDFLVGGESVATNL